MFTRHDAEAPETQASTQAFTSMTIEGYEEALLALPDDVIESLLVGEWPDRVTSIESYVKTMPGALVGVLSEELCPVKHSFGDGCYVREWSCPAGVLIVSKIHKIKHPVFMLEGEVSVLTEAGVERIVAPCHTMTLAGTKRVLFTHTPAKWVTVHVTDETDLAKIEEQIIAKDYDELNELISDEQLAQLVGTDT